MIVVAAATGCSRSCIIVRGGLRAIVTAASSARLSLPSSCCGICDGGGAISPQRGFPPAEMSTDDCDCRFSTYLTSISLPLSFSLFSFTWLYLPLLRRDSHEVHRGRVRDSAGGGMTIPWTLIPHARKSRLEEICPRSSSHRLRLATRDPAGRH